MQIYIAYQKVFLPCKRLSSTDDDFFNSHTLSYDTPLNNSNEDFLDIPIPSFSTPKACQMEANIK